MSFRVSAAAALAIGCLGLPALAEERQPWTERVADFFHARPEPPAVTRSATTSVAAFPDVAPERPKAAPDSALELLATNPYEAELQAHKIAMNLHGEDLDRESPYADQLRFANPYTEDLHLVNPYMNARPVGVPLASRRVAAPTEIENPYASMRVSRAQADAPDLENPYAARSR